MSWPQNSFKPNLDSESSSFGPQQACIEHLKTCYLTLICRPYSASRSCFLYALQALSLINHVCHSALCKFSLFSILTHHTLFWMALWWFEHPVKHPYTLCSRFFYQLTIVPVDLASVGSTLARAFKRKLFLRLGIWITVVKFIPLTPLWIGYFPFQIPPSLSLHCTFISCTLSPDSYHDILLRYLATCRSDSLYSLLKYNGL